MFQKIGPESTAANRAVSVHGSRQGHPSQRCAQVQRFPNIRPRKRDTCVKKRLRWSKTLHLCTTVGSVGESTPIIDSRIARRIDPGIQPRVDPSGIELRIDPGGMHARSHAVRFLCWCNWCILTIPFICCIFGSPLLRPRPSAMERMVLELESLRANIATLGTRRTTHADAEWMNQVANQRRSTKSLKAPTDQKIKYQKIQKTKIKKTKIKNKKIEKQIQKSKTKSKWA